MSHAFLAPSSAHIWGKPDGCRAYPLVAATFPQEDTPESRDGDACHEAGAAAIRAKLQGGDAGIKAGWVASNGVVLDDDQVEAVEMYVDDVIQIARKYGVFGGPHVGVEQHFGPTPSIHPDNGGTPDTWLYAKAAHRLIIWDGKFGFGVVEARDNWQCVNYGALIMHHLGINGLSDQTLTVEMRIVQPFAPHPDGPIRNWVVKGSDLRPYINTLEASAIECMDLSPLARTGSHCRYCPGRASCTVNQRAAMACVDEAGRLELHTASPDALALELRILRRAADMLAHRLTGLEQQAESLAKAGTRLPGLALTPTYGRDRWKVGTKEVYALGELFGVDLRQDKPVTPNQAIKAGVDTTVIKDYIDKPKTGVKLVADDATLASRVFTPRSN